MGIPEDYPELVKNLSIDDLLRDAAAVPSGTYQQVRARIDRRLSSRPEVPAEVMAAANKLMDNMWNTYIPQNMSDRKWSDVTDAVMLDARLAAQFILSLSPATPEVR